MKNLNNEKGYRYGFNGKESDVDFGSGDGNVYDYGFRIYNAQIAKFLSVDPLTKSYPELTTFQYASNNPILMIDLDGLEGYVPKEIYEFGYFIEQKVKDCGDIIGDATDNVTQVLMGIAKATFKTVNSTMPSMKSYAMTEKGLTDLETGLVKDNSVWSFIGMQNPSETSSQIKRIYNSGSLQEKAEITTQIAFGITTFSRGLKGLIKAKPISPRTPVYHPMKGYDSFGSRSSISTPTVNGTVQLRSTVYVNGEAFGGKNIKPGGFYPTNGFPTALKAEQLKVPLWNGNNILKPVIAPQLSNSQGLWLKGIGFTGFGFQLTWKIAEYYLKDKVTLDKQETVIPVIKQKKP